MQLTGKDIHPDSSDQGIIYTFSFISEWDLEHVPEDERDELYQELIDRFAKSIGELMFVKQPKISTTDNDN